MSYFNIPQCYFFLIIVVFRSIKALEAEVEWSHMMDKSSVLCLLKKKRKSRLDLQGHGSRSTTTKDELASEYNWSESAWPWCFFSSLDSKF